MTQLVHLDGEIVATVGGRRFFLTPRIQALAVDDPTAQLDAYVRLRPRRSRWEAAWPVHRFESRSAWT